MKYLAHISYNGSKYYGFQRLNNQKGVQNELENILSIIENNKVEVKGSGRTDRYVHAIDQCIHFKLEREIPLEKLKYTMNKMLSNAIHINKLEIVPEDFHARHSVKRKTYLYKIYQGEKNPFLSDFVYFYPQKLNMEKMKKASTLFLGTHDFRNFVSGERINYISNIESLKIEKKEEEILFEITGKSFYRYMVRSIVGALIEIGRETKEITNIKEALETTKEIRFFIAPPEGLYLKKIEY